LKEENSLFQFLQCDLASPTGPADAVKACHVAFGPRIDILQNVAGIMDTYNSADTFTDDTWDRVIAVNLTGPVKLMREVLQAMKSQGSGAIVNIASSAATSGNWAGVAYTASKHGIVSHFSSQTSSIFCPYLY
jgi:NAD(P)-dependent dehydrogenase (short-subunit alcohol dehydrogenase family)